VKGKSVTYTVSVPGNNRHMFIFNF